VIITRRQWVTLVFMLAACGCPAAIDAMCWDAAVWDRAAWA
jgi:hypothetical protein